MSSMIKHHIRKYITMSAHNVTDLRGNEEVKGLFLDALIEQEIKLNDMAKDLEERQAGVLELQEQISKQREALRILGMTEEELTLGTSQ